MARSPVLTTGVGGAIPWAMSSINHQWLALLFLAAGCADLAELNDLPPIPATGTSTGPEVTSGSGTSEIADDTSGSSGGMGGSSGDSSASGSTDETSSTSGEGTTGEPEAVCEANESVGSCLCSGVVAPPEYCGCSFNETGECICGEAETVFSPEVCVNQPIPECVVDFEAETCTCEGGVRGDIQEDCLCLLVLGQCMCSAPDVATAPPEICGCGFDPAGDCICNGSVQPDYVCGYPCFFADEDCFCGEYLAPDAFCD